MHSSMSMERGKDGAQMGTNVIKYNAFGNIGHFSAFLEIMKVQNVKLWNDMTFIETGIYLKKIFLFECC